WSRYSAWGFPMGQNLRIVAMLRFVPLLAAPYFLLLTGPFAEPRFLVPALLGFTSAQGTFWALILSFPPPLREGRSELSKRASARVQRRSTKPSLWLTLGLGLTLLGTLLLFPGGISPEWGFRFGLVLLTPMQLILGFNCISSMIRTPLANGERGCFLIAFLLPACVSVALS
ncbi:MAG: hypothetical protein MK291_07205, partial [Planctomycetes bacterium]|nr:hypothetical protein [Planctomycetota bacterium]